MGPCTEGGGTLAVATVSSKSLRLLLDIIRKRALAGQPFCILQPAALTKKKYDFLVFAGSINDVIFSRQYLKYL